MYLHNEHKVVEVDDLDGSFFLEKEDDPTLQSHTTARLKPMSKQQLCYTYSIDEGALIVCA